MRHPVRRVLPPVAFAFLLTLAISAPVPVAAQLLTFVEAEVQADLAGVEDLAVAPDGDNVYAVSRTRHTLVALAVDPGTGELTWIETEEDGVGGVDGLRRPLAVAVSSDGAHVYVAGNQDDAIAAFERAPATGLLGFVGAVFNGVGGVDGIWQVKGVAVGPSGGWVAASGRSDPAAPKGAVAIFARDPVAGTLSFSSMVREGDPPGVAGLGNGGAVAFSPDGANLYAVTSANAVVVFSFDEVTGALGYLQTLQDGVGGVDGLAGAARIAFGPGGEQAYVTGETDDALAVFARDPLDGMLTPLEVLRDTGATAGFDGASGVALSPVGDLVYVAASVDSAAAALGRVPATGRVSWIEAQTDGVAGVDGLAGAIDVEVSPSGFVYAGGANDGAIAVFAPGTAWDFGDAPDPTFPTLLLSDGARHVILPGFHLGSGADGEPDGAPSAAADGDDTNGADDEDGVVFTVPLIPGGVGEIEVVASQGGALDAWIDFLADGDWDDAGEQVAAGFALVAGTNAIPIAVPATAVPDAVVGARFRLRLVSDPALAPTGAAPSGEVEDLVVPIGRGADLGVLSVAPATADWNEPFQVTVTASNAGPNDVAAAGVSVAISANGGAVSWTCAATGGSCSPSGSGDIDDLVDLTAGGSLVYTVSGVVPDQAPGPEIVASSSIEAPAGVVDPVASNDAAESRILIPSIFLDGFETGDTSRWSSTAP
ncbi:MAG TPA: beta-propeller fold lactonase family protein [Thermoanaerobaculia bacterium]|nr:beta-propeller fold lactonase family protein [Thermoanaerobaculia bacterium]